VNRDGILSEIQLQLQEPIAESGNVRPLGEVVGAVAQVLRTGTDKQPAPVTVPAWQVAAFVDGSLSTDEENLVVDAILADNSVLAEVVAAVRSQQTAFPNTEFPVHHQSRLFEMIRTQQPVQAVALSSSSEQGDFESQTRPQIRSQPNSRKRSSGWRASMLAAATAIALVLGTTALVVSFLQPEERFVQNEDPGGVAKDSTGDRGLAANDQFPSIPPTPEGEFIETQSNLAPDPEVGSDESSSLAENPVGSDAVDGSAQPLNSMPISPPPNALAAENEIENTGDKMPLNAEPNPARTDPASSEVLVGLRWKKIEGLVVQHESGEGSPESIDIESSGNLPIWNRLRQQDLVLKPEASQQPARIRTLPLSRGEIEIPGSESTIVVGPDSEMRLAADNLDSRRLNIELQHGAFAIAKTAAELRLRLSGYDRRLGEVRLREDSSVVFSYSPLGLQFDLHRGSAEVNGQNYKSGTYAFTEDGSIVNSNQLASMPSWTTRLEKEIPKRVLDLVKEEKDLAGEIAKRIQQLRANPANTRDLGNLAVLAQVQTALVGEQAPRLLASDIAMMRLAALNRLVSIPAWDPRYRAVWANSVKTTKNRRLAVQLKTIANQVRDGKPLNARQIEMLITGMASQESASRAMSYLMLKKAFPQGPPFDPNWTVQLRLRSINAWRKNFGLPLLRNRAAAAGKAMP
jgi:hypothetical protein